MYDTFRRQIYKKIIPYYKFLETFQTLKLVNPYKEPVFDFEMFVSEFNVEKD
jgi:hypothetical protein